MKGTVTTVSVIFVTTLKTDEILFVRFVGKVDA